MTMSNSSSEVVRSSSVGRIVRDAVFLVVVGVACGVVSNLLRGQERLPWVQTKPYDIVVPCPEPVGQVTGVPPESSTLRDFTTFVIDARSATDFATWHWPGAVNVPFDWLGPPVAEEVRQLAKRLTASKSQRIVVYGDGDDPDSGREWARLLAGGGIRNVAYVEGGAPALMKAHGPPSLPTSTASSREGTP
jgi:rhodanese-related sulfurtransferase